MFETATPGYIDNSRYFTLIIVPTAVLPIWHNERWLIPLNQPKTQIETKILLLGTVESQSCRFDHIIARKLCVNTTCRKTATTVKTVIYNRVPHCLPIENA